MAAVVPVVTEIFPVVRSDEAFVSCGDSVTLSLGDFSRIDAGLMSGRIRPFFEFVSVIVGAGWIRFFRVDASLPIILFVSSEVE